MGDRYEELYKQLDGYTVRSDLCSSTSKGKSKKIEMYTTIYGNQKPEVKYVVTTKSGKSVIDTDNLANAVVIYLGDE